MHTSHTTAIEWQSIIAIIARGRHSAGNVTGLSVREFLALPARSQVSLSYDGSDNAQGFLSLRKL
jgi:hypothetical protein